MAARNPLVIGADGLPQQLQAADTLPASALGYATGSNANGSWRKDPDGTIEQFGTVTLANGTATVTFPIPFPNGCAHVDPVPVSGSVAGASVSAWLNAPPTKTGAVINGRSFTSLLGVLNIGLGAFDVKWHAIGN